jgi:hypothetical protein
LEHGNTGGDGLHEKSFSATPDSDGDIGLPKKLELTQKLSSLLCLWIGLPNKKFSSVVLSGDFLRLAKLRPSFVINEVSAANETELLLFFPSESDSPIDKIDSCKSSWKRRAA